VNPFESTNLYIAIYLAKICLETGMECGTTESTRFRPLSGTKWDEAKSNDLVKVTWVKGVVLCNSCYMRFVENPLNRSTKRARVSTVEDAIVREEATIREEAEDTIGEDTEATIEDTEVTNEEKVSMINLTGAIKAMAKIFYEREYLRKESPIYAFDEMRK
jgi:hypothetical protein